MKNLHWIYMKEGDSPPEGFQKVKIVWPTDPLRELSGRNVDEFMRNKIQEKTNRNPRNN